MSPHKSTSTADCPEIDTKAKARQIATRIIDGSCRHRTKLLARYLHAALDVVSGSYAGWTRERIEKCSKMYDCLNGLITLDGVNENNPTFLGRSIDFLVAAVTSMPYTEDVKSAAEGIGAKIARFGPAETWGTIQTMEAGKNFFDLEKMLTQGKTSYETRDAQAWTHVLSPVLPGPRSPF